MKRKAYTELVEWKSQRRGEVALLIEGARRIGKSYIVEEFAKNEYESYLLIDFNSVNPMVKEFFDIYLDDIDTLLNNLQYYGGKKLTPRSEKGEVGKSLIIFDEVQFCPRARSAIKYLVADGRFDYIETGSLVSIKKNVKGILLPSEERRIEMHPMDFEEFIWAKGEEMLMELVRSNFEKSRPMGALFHRKAMDLFRQYLIVGGMPQAVNKWIETKDFVEVDKVKRDILTIYQNDIKNYADNQESRVSQIFAELPGQLQKHEKRFLLSSLGRNARMREYSDAFFWLSDAKIINCCYNATSPNVGLRLNEDRSTVKCYVGDTGLLVSMAFDEPSLNDGSLYKKLLFGKLEINEGMLTENIVAQMLRAAKHDLFFYSKASEDDASERMEIDFLVTKSNVTSRHNIRPIEVKSGKGFTINSLKKCIAKFGAYISDPVVLYDGDVKTENGILYLPLYMAGLL